jgi:hypothetical protein
MKPRNNYSDELGKVLFESLFDVARKLNQLSTPGFIACDGCGKIETLENMKNAGSVMSPVYVCKKCWDEFMRES